MMAGNPSWWSMHSNLRSSSPSDNHHEQVSPSLFISQNTHLSNNHLSPDVHHQQYIHGSSSSSSSSSSFLPFSFLGDPHAQDFPHSWSQLLLGGMASEEDQERYSSSSHFQSTRVMSSVGDVKQELSSQNNNNLYANQFQEDQPQEEAVGFSNRAAPWTQIIMPASSPKSCVTTLSSNNNNNIINNNNSNNNINNYNNMLDFSTSKRSLEADSNNQHAADNSNSECNSTSTGGVTKKPRIQSSSNPPLKVRKEKLGDRITALHQLVSPFGKTDTASVLLEAIGYIRFLQAQIEALSSPYLRNTNASPKNPQSTINGERNCLFPDHPGQLLNDSCMKRRGATNHEDNKESIAKDLKSRGLCLVPISCTHLVGSDNGADYWAQSLGGGF